MKEIKEIIASNLAAYRRREGLTQQQLAEKLNYSDKAVSKWERAESVPDVIVLKAIADLYGIKVDDLLSERAVPTKAKTKGKRLTHWLVAALSAGLVWLVATIVMVVWQLIDSSQVVAGYIYLTALPASLIVIVVFSCIWGKLWHTGLSVSALIWSLCVLINVLLPFEDSWLVFLIGAVLQVLIILWTALLLVLKKGKRLTEKTFGASDGSVDNQA